MVSTWSTTRTVYLWFSRPPLLIQLPRVQLRAEFTIIQHIPLPLFPLHPYFPQQISFLPLMVLVPATYRSPTRTSLLRRLFITSPINWKGSTCMGPFGCFRMQQFSFRPACQNKKSRAVCCLWTMPKEQWMRHILACSFCPICNLYSQLGTHAFKTVWRTSAIWVAVVDPSFNFPFVSNLGYQRNGCLVVIFNGNIQRMCEFLED